MSEFTNVNDLAGNIFSNFQKSTVKQHTRQSKSGKLSNVKQHEDSRQKKIKNIETNTNTDRVHKPHRLKLFSASVGEKVMFQGIESTVLKVNKDYVDLKQGKNKVRVDKDGDVGYY